MIDLLAGVHAIDIVLAVVAFEAVLIMAYWRKTGRGIPPSDLLPNLLAGAALLVALRLALSGFSWPYYTSCLAAAGAANVVDIRQRWR